MDLSTASLALRSIAQEKAKHATNAIATSGAVLVAPEVSTLGMVIEWAPYVVGLLVSCAILYKTLLDIKLDKLKIESERLEIAKNGRREADRG